MYGNVHNEVVNFAVQQPFEAQRWVEVPQKRNIILC